VIDQSKKSHALSDAFAGAASADVDIAAEVMLLDTI
jgi:hypothetical protein